MERLIQKINLKDITKFAKQYKDVDVEIMNSLRESFKKFGFYKLFCVRKNFDSTYLFLHDKIYYDVLTSLNVEEVECVVYENLTNEESMLLYIINNEYKFENDYVTMSKIFSSLSRNMSIKDISSVLNYTFEDVEDIVNMIKIDWRSIRIEKEPSFEMF